MTGQSTAARRVGERMRVPFTTTTRGLSDCRSEAVPGSLADSTLTTPGQGVVSIPVSARISAIRLRPRHRSRGSAPTTNSTWPATVGQPTRRARRVAIRRREGADSTITRRSSTAPARWLATMSVVSPGPAKRTTGPGSARRPGVKAGEASGVADGDAFEAAAVGDGHCGELRPARRACAGPSGCASAPWSARPPARSRCPGRPTPR